MRGATPTLRPKDGASISRSDGERQYAVEIHIHVSPGAFTAAVSSHVPNVCPRLAVAVDGWVGAVDVTAGEEPVVFLAWPGGTNDEPARLLPCALTGDAPMRDTTPVSQITAREESAARFVRRLRARSVVYEGAFTSVSACFSAFAASAFASTSGRSS